MNYCPVCGFKVSLRTPDNDNFTRHICEGCGQIHYHNPIVVAGCIPQWRGQVLLCRRAIEPGYGYWTAPGGFLENGETVQQCAEREAMEEANVRVSIDSLLSVTNVIQANQVHLFFQASMEEPHFYAGDESLEVRLFHSSDIPWDEIAFYSVENTLRQFTSALPDSSGRVDTLCGTSTRPPRQKPQSDLDNPCTRNFRQDYLQMENRLVETWNA